VTSHETFLFLVTLSNISCASHVTDHKTLSIFSNAQGAFTHDLRMSLFDWLVFLGRIRFASHMTQDSTR